VLKPSGQTAADTRIRILDAADEIFLQMMASDLPLNEEIDHSVFYGYFHFGSLDAKRLLEGGKESAFEREMAGVK
jgi:hypothetical protein